MIAFQRFRLDNGLTLIVHEDQTTPMVAVNILYQVGSRDESADKTGFAHLFEHLMFSGSAHAEAFDTELQRAGGENNAFTNKDYTNFYNILPAQNIETALWLESDRMQSLNINAESFQTQQRVVIEEFKETCLNEPFGDVWHHLAELVYTEHPYRWPVIGKDFDHIARATLDDVRSFYANFYGPNNAILVIAGSITPHRALELTKKWFGDIPARPCTHPVRPAEPTQTNARHADIHAHVPVDALYLSYPCPPRKEQDFFVVDMLSDLLGNGPSSRLFRRLLKEQQLFSSIDCYVTGTFDQGELIIEGRPTDGVALDQARTAVQNELAAISETPISERELRKLKTRIETALFFSEISILNKAINLAFYEYLCDAAFINKEEDIYENITAEDLQAAARTYLKPTNCCSVFYMAKKTSV